MGNDGNSFRHNTLVSACATAYSMLPCDAAIDTLTNVLCDAAFSLLRIQRVQNAKDRLRLLRGTGGYNFWIHKHKSSNSPSPTHMPLQPHKAGSRTHAPAKAQDENNLVSLVNMSACIHKNAVQGLYLHLFPKGCVHKSRWDAFASHVDHATVLFT